MIHTYEALRHLLVRLCYVQHLLNGFRVRCTHLAGQRSLYLIS